MELQPFHYHGVYDRDNNNRCYIQHYTNRRLPVIEYQILVSQTEQPKMGGFYKDADGDLFIWIGTGPQGEGAPWLQIEEHGAYTRSSTFVAEPLYELSPEKYAEALNELRS